MTRGDAPRPVRRVSAFPSADTDEEARIEPDDEAEQVIDVWRVRIGRGEAVDPETEIRARPLLADRLRDGFAALALLDRAYGDVDPAAALVGRMLGAWRLESVLGSGGMGTVYRATDGADARVAVKVIHPHLLERPGFFKRFLREAEIGRRVRHANVVRTLDADECVEGAVRRRFLVMEYVEGRTLRALLAEMGKVPEALCRHIGREIAAALAAIHAAGAVHRDLKPENVLVTNDHVVKVMDLGVARLADEAARLSQTGAFVGSLLYGAPEQLAGKGDVDARADLHALGLVLYELATGAHPFAHDDFRVVIRRIADERPRRCGELDPQIAPFFEEVVATLLAKNPDERFASADELLRVLDDGEESAWWRERAKAIRATTKRPLRRMRIPRETALYGRDAETSRMRALFERTKSGDGQVVLVEGEAGIGKSRLVDEFVAGLVREGEDVEFLYGSYPPGGAATASGAFTTAYREHFGDDEEALREALPVTPLLVPAFAALLRGDAAPTGAEPLTKDSLQTVFVHATRSLAQRRPTIVLIDDLHFAPEEGRALFASLALAVPGHRVLLVGTTRPGIDEKWSADLGRHEQTTRFVLTRLGPKDLVLLLRDSLKSEHLAEELSARIAVKSDGNPFFVFEILRGLRQGQFLTKRADGTWVSTQVIRDIQVPSSVTDLVQARISDLGEDDRNALEVASCIGFEWDPVLVAAVLGVARVPLLQRLGRIEKTHRVVRSAGRRFVFDHHQIQETLYAGVPEVLREEYHAAIASAMEAAAGAAEKEPEALDGALCVDLAEHFLKGAQGVRALRYLDAALSRLEKAYLNDAAVRLAERALVVPGLLAGRERCEMLVRCSTALNSLCRWVEERETLESARSLADSLGDPRLRAQARNRLGWHLVYVWEFEPALVAFEDAVAIARAADDHELVASATCNMGNALLNLNRFEAANTALERGLSLCRAIELRIGENHAIMTMGMLFNRRGNPVEARSWLERSVRMAAERGDRRHESHSLANLGIALKSLGLLDEARGAFERGLAMGRSAGDRRGEAAAFNGLAILSMIQLRWGSALADLERVLGVSLEIGDRRAEAIARANVGFVLVAVGARQRARAVLEEALRLCRELALRPTEANALSHMGLAMAEDGDVAAASRFHLESLAIRRDSNFEKGVVGSLLRIGELRRDSGDASGARCAVDEALAISRTHGLTEELVESLALSACMTGDGAPAAEAALANAGPVADSALVRFLLWQATNDRAHLVEAKRFLDLGVRYAPPDCRESMVRNVRLHREIAAAAKAAGL